MNYYPETLKAIVAYIEALNEVDKTIDTIGTDGLPYLAVIQLTDRDGTNFGVLRDEIGGSWSWFPTDPIEGSERA